MARFSPIDIQPGMDPQMMAQVINSNFRQVAESNRTNIITDENGNNRILLGKPPKGDYGLFISKPGVDVVKELQNG